MFITEKQIRKIIKEEIEKLCLDENLEEGWKQNFAGFLAGLGLMGEVGGGNALAAPRGTAGDTAITRRVPNSDTSNKEVDKKYEGIPPKYHKEYDKYFSGFQRFGDNYQTADFATRWFLRNLHDDDSIKVNKIKPSEVTDYKQIMGRRNWFQNQEEAENAAYDKAVKRINIIIHSMPTKEQLANLSNDVSQNISNKQIIKVKIPRSIKDGSLRNTTVTNIARKIAKQRGIEYKNMLEPTSADNGDPKTATSFNVVVEM